MCVCSILITLLAISQVVLLALLLFTTLLRNTQGLCLGVSVQPREALRTYFQGRFLLITSRDDSASHEQQISLS